MKVERITTDTYPLHTLQESERLARDEKQTLTSDAVTFDGHRREPGSNPKFKKQQDSKDLEQDEVLITDGEISPKQEHKIDIVV